MGSVGTEQLCFEFAASERASAERESRSGTFVDNLRLPIHRWYRYSAGFSAEWARSFMQHRCSTEDCAVLDPFAGCGTTLVAAEEAGLRSVGVENHPFIYRVARTKLLWHASADDFREAWQETLRRARWLLPKTTADPDVSDLLRRCYTEEALRRLLLLREAFSNLTCSDEARELVWLALTSILRSVSHVGTAQWQYVLPNRKKSNHVDAFEAFEQQCQIMAYDMAFFRRTVGESRAQVIKHDARLPLNTPCKFDLLVTSPPYPNNYDYADATRLEMTFWGEVNRWGDLQSAARKHLIRSCSQHSAAERLQLDPLLESPLLEPIRAGLKTACGKLSRVREERGGRKTYHTMVAAYFLDLARVWHTLRTVMRSGADICFVVGDSAPYGVYVPVDRWLGELALSAGFKSYSFEKLRDRNIKWRNRKHRVPLKEGRLWVKG